MKMTKEVKRTAALQIARWAFDELRAQGNRFYYYKNYYYFRIDGGKGWLEDFEDHDEIIFQLRQEGLVEPPWTKYKRVIPDELRRLAKSVALPVNTAGINRNKYSTAGHMDREQAEDFVNACDERNTQPMKGN
jgi:hypothetical protein